MDNPTEKQAARVKRLINHIGAARVNFYLQSRFPGANLDELTKDQAQKIITGMMTQEKGHGVIYGVVGRDIPFSNERY